jgi:ABC-type glycerol-3-phosphate transport system substrate-binding protein
VLPLTIWTTEAFSPTQVITSGRILAQQVSQFEANQPGVQVRFVLKKPYGKGGILDFLLNTEAVVPALLPDLVILDVDELPAAVQAGLLQPLDDLLPAELVGDLVPPARAAATIDGQLYGLQFQADLDHLAYNTSRVTVPPSSWARVLQGPGPYIFPAGGQSELVNDAFLIQLLAVRPWPSEVEPGAPFLDADSLTAVLQFYQDGVSRGILPPRILEQHTADDSWRDYLTGEAAITQVSAHRYLTERGGVLASGVAPIPAIDGPAKALNRGWALALVTSDPARQAAAVGLMSQLMAPETSASWNQAADYLPTRQSAWAFWRQGDPYATMIQQQLQAARPRPTIPNYTRIAAALQQAVEDVLTGAATPEEAATRAVESVQ